MSDPKGEIPLISQMHFAVLDVACICFGTLGGLKIVPFFV